MAATKEDVESWIDEATDYNNEFEANNLKRRVTHIISVCDRFSYDDYPVYVYNDENLEERRMQIQGADMQKINEVIIVKY